MPTLVEPVAGLRRQQQMVDPQALVLLPGAGLVVPEGVEPGLVGDRAQRIGQAEAEQGLESLARLGLEQRVLGPGGGIVDVAGCRNDVEVAGEDQRLLGLEPLLRILKKPRHPFELVGIFLGSDRIAVGQIEAGDAQHAALERHHAFEEAGMGVLVVAGEARLGLVERQLRQQRDAVEGLLPVGDDVVAERLDLQPREGLVDAFDLLQADDVRLALLSQVSEKVDPLPDRIDVPGGDAHDK